MRNGEYNLAIAPEDYPDHRKYRGRYIPEHHLVWWENTGEVVKKGEVIHHKDGNKRNNDFSNLEKKDSGNHVADHQDATPIAVLKCPDCGSVFRRLLRNTHMGSSGRRSSFCSNPCAGRYSQKHGKAEPSDIGVYSRKEMSNGDIIIEV